MSFSSAISLCTLFSLSVPFSCPPSLTLGSAALPHHLGLPDIKFCLCRAGARESADVCVCVCVRILLKRVQRARQCLCVLLCVSVEDLSSARLTAASYLLSSSARNAQTSITLFSAALRREENASKLSSQHCFFSLFFF